MNLDPVEREVEAALAGLSPAAPAIGRDRLMFEAGKREGMRIARRGVVGWRVMSGALAGGLLVSVSLHSMTWHDKEQPLPGGRMVAATRGSEGSERVQVVETDAAVVLGGNEGIWPERALPAASYGAMRRKWDAGEAGWLDSRRRVPGENPRVREGGGAWGGTRSGLIGDVRGAGGRL